MKKYDERETLFSRVNLIKDSKEYKAFYKKNPSFRQNDDKMRRIPFRHKLRNSDRFKELFFPMIQHNKQYIRALHELHDTVEVGKKVTLPPNFESNIKEITKYYGATNVGITKLNDLSYYSHFGGLNEALGITDNYGKKITDRYDTAIVFTVKMDLKKINRAPHFEELMATEEGYLQVALIGSRLSTYLKTLGYKSMFNSGEFYLAPLVPLALDAGLGEIGMCNHLVTKEHGDSVRLGAVFTNLDLKPDQKVDFGLQDFCKKCALCLMNCPSHAITHKTRDVNGRTFYKFRDHECFDMWMKTGTDCGVCIQSCPFTQGVDLSKLERIKEEPSVIDEMIDEHMETHGRRNYIHGDLPIVALEDEVES